MVASNDRRIVYKLGVEAEPAARHVLDNFARQAALVQSRIARSLHGASTSSPSPSTAERDKARKEERERRERATQNKRDVDKFLKDLDDADKKEQQQKAAASRQIAKWQKQADDEERREKEKRAKQNAKDVDNFLKQQDAAEKKGQKDSAKQQAAADKKAKADEREAIEKAKLAQERLNESLHNGLDAAMKLVRGFVLLGSTGEADTRKILDNLLAVQGTIDSVRGGIDTVRNLSGAIKGLREAGGLTKLLTGASAAAPAAGAGVSGATGAVGATGITAAGAATAAAATGVAAALVAAIGLAADQALNDGRFTTLLGKKFGAALIRASDSIHETRVGFRKFGMSEGERLQYERETSLRHEDTSGLQATPANGGVFSAIGQLTRGVFSGSLGASGRNYERLRRKSERELSQLEFRREVEHVEASPNIREAELAQEERDREAADKRRLASVYRRAGITDYFQGSLNKAKTVRETGRTGIGATPKELGLDFAPQAFRPNSIFSDARLIRDQGERARFLQERRNENNSNFFEQQTLKQRDQSLLATRADITAKRDQTDEHSPARMEFEEKLKAIDEERRRIAQETGALRLRMQQQEIQNAAKLLEYAHKNTQTSQQKFKERTGAVENLEERIGTMSPMEVAHLVQARKRAEAGGQLSLQDIEALDNSDERGRFLAAEAKRKRSRDLLTQAGGEDLIGNVERRKAEASGRETEQRYAQEGQAVRELSGATNNVIVGGEYSVTIDIRDDMQLAEDLGIKLDGFRNELKSSNAAIMKAVRRMIDDTVKQMNSQNRVSKGNP